MSLSLEHIAGSRAGEVDDFELEELGKITLGRLPECEVAFDPEEDRAASGRHARIVLEHGDYFIEDLASSNGTLVNGKAVTGRRPLFSGDLIECGADGPVLRVTLDLEQSDTMAMPVPETMASPAVPKEVVERARGWQVEQSGPSSEGASSGGSGVGARTVALMIDKATHRTSRKFTLLMGALAVLLVLAVVVIVLLAIRAEKTEEEQAAKLEEAEEKFEERTAELESKLETERNRQSARDFTDRLRQKQAIDRQIEDARVEVTAELRDEFEKRQEELVKSLTEVETTLNENYGDALFMLGFSPDAEALDELGVPRPSERPGYDEGFCTAFAITADGWLATNAHCIDGLWEIRYDLGRNGIETTFFAKRNGDSETRYPLLMETAKAHPGYTHARSPDVGLVKLDLAAIGKTEVDVHTWVAPRDSVQELSVGQPVYTIGFPGKVMDPYRVEASFRGGNVARLTDFDNQSAEAPENQFVWHTALISKGTSGSPMFDRFGRVVAINNGTMSAEQIVTSDGKTETVKTIYSADGLNFGVRVDLLHELAGEKQVEIPVPPDDIVPLLDLPGEESP